ncbi:MAG: helicase-related protein [Candidatus Sericytochromatia bacterium]
MNLKEHNWKIRYNNDEDDLINDFYIPALSCAVSYDRKAGFFSSSALAIASKGVAQLIKNNGKMRLLVSHHLSEEDVGALERGYKLKDLLKETFFLQLEVPDDSAFKDRLGILSWLVGHGNLEVRVVVKLHKNGNYDVGSLFHEKTGIITDSQGDNISFSGSINESAQAWKHNQESFCVFKSWDGSKDYLENDKKDFERIWNGETTKIKVVDFTDAIKEKLLQYMPKFAPTDLDNLSSSTSEKENNNDVFDASDIQNQITSASDTSNASNSATDMDISKNKEELDLISPFPSEEGIEGCVRTPEEEKELFRKIKEAPKQGMEGKRLTFTTSTISPLPHQQRVFLKASKNFPESFMFSDEVGLGKTIEAGSLIRYLLMSEQVKRVLLLVPKSVLKQWHTELYEKFNLHFWLFTGKTFELFNGKIDTVKSSNPWNQKEIILASSHLAKRKDRREQLLHAEDWDLVITDEAHHARRKNPSQKSAAYTPNLLLNLLEKLKNKTKCLYLLTATPMQVDMIEAWDLLRLLNIKGRWGKDNAAFLQYYSSLQEGINTENLKFLGVMSQESIEDGLEEEIKEKLGEKYAPNIVRKIERYIRKGNIADLINNLGETGFKACLEEILHEVTPLKKKMFRNTREQLREYKRLGLLKEKIAIRNPEDIFIDFSTTEAIIYDEIDDFIKNYFTQPHGQSELSLGFISSIYKRRASSSLTALKLSLENRKAKLKGQLNNFISEEDWDEDLEPENNEFDNEEGIDNPLLDAHQQEREITKIDELLNLVSQSKEDTKFEKFITHLKSNIGEGHYQAIVFTQYTDTMDYIKNKILNDYQSELACYSGRGGEQFDGYNWSKLSKDEIKKRFKEQKIQILLCTDAAAEGLNLQTAGLLYNYDMPWNPMRVEQRIGRIDRIGQEKDRISIVNFYYSESVEAKIYEVLRERIDCFSTVVGNLQPILATISRRIEEVSTGESSMEQVISKINEDIEIARTSIDLGKFSDSEITYNLEETTPSINNQEIEDIFINSRALKNSGYIFSKSDSAGIYNLSLPDGITKKVTFIPKIFEENSQSVELMSYMNPIFDQLIQYISSLE